VNCEQAEKWTIQMRSHPRDNRLLAALPQDSWQRLRPALEPAPLAHRQEVYAGAEPINHAYFPTTALVSLMHFTDSGASSESAVVGNDGMLGISLLMGGGLTCSHAVVLNAGDAFRLPAQTLKDEFQRAGPAMEILLRYTQALLTQMAQRAVCNRHHSLAQQLAGCLLLSLDRNADVDADILMTQELIANRLGVRREGVTAGIHLLQQLGVISTTRGHIKVLSRAGLESRSCECYEVVKRECNRLVPEREPLPRTPEPAPLLARV
jgi:CRP-like cAMP-binding protein